MEARLAFQRYGKHSVRVSKVRRPRRARPKDETHEFVEVSVDVELEGAFDAAYLEGDNRSVVATDTCKNTIYVLAKDDSLDSIEAFGRRIASHFIERYDHVDSCHVALRERVWTRLGDSPHVFLGDQRMTPTANVVRARNGTPQVKSGLTHLLIAKTTESGFADFHESEFRTLADTHDRILATEVTAEWSYGQLLDDYVASRHAIVATLLARFADHYSRSVQETLYFMGQAVLAARAEVSDISLTLPNKHHLLANLASFGRDNDNEVFVATDEPFGFISATITR